MKHVLSWGEKANMARGGKGQKIKENGKLNHVLRGLSQKFVDNRNLTFFNEN